MGIDIYATWAGMSDGEKQEQYTGFSTEHGHVGYLREAYHGRPYATRELLPETWDQELFIEASEDDPNYEGVEVKAIDLMGRLPKAIVTSLYRGATLYKEPHARRLLMNIGIEPEAPKPSHPGHIDLGEEGPGALLKAVQGMMAEATSKGSDEVPFSHLALNPDWMIKAIEQDSQVRSLVGFVKLVADKEQETGKPVRIVNSY